MLHVLPKTVLILFAISTLLSSQVFAYCSRCVKIEEDRAKEQAAHPQPWHYYDDQVSKNDEGEISNEANKKPSGDSVNTGSGALSGSTYRSSTEKDKLTNSSNLDDRSLNISKNLSDSNLLAAANFSTQRSSSLPNKNDKMSYAAPANDKSLTGDDFFEEVNIHDSKYSQPSEVGKNNSQKANAPNASNPSSAPLASEAYSTLYTILKTKNFLEALDSSFTLLIPSDEALRQLPPGILNELTSPANGEKLAALVSNHVIAKKILKKDFIENNSLEVKAISGKNLTLSHKDGKLYIDDIPILRMEAAAYNGVIYVIGSVLTP